MLMRALEETSVLEFTSSELATWVSKQLSQLAIIMLMTRHLKIVFRMSAIANYLCT